jgi:hypothetical protein
MEVAARTLRDHDGLIRPEDDGFRPRTDDPFWNESAWFSFMVPERSITGFVYFYHRPNIGYSVGGCGFWDPTGEETYNCRYFDWGEPFPLAGSMYDFTLGNGLSARCTEALKSFEFSYRSQHSWEGRGSDLELDLAYEAFMPPHNTGLPAGSEDLGKGHYEQPGRMRGTLRYEGELIDVDCWSERDRSWGPRRLGKNPRGHFPWAIASETSGFQLLAVSDLPPDQDPVIGTAEPVISGWYLKDGIYGHVTAGAGHVAVTERTPEGRPDRLECHATDHLGRTLEAQGRARNMFNFNGYEFLMLWWGMVEWEFDGQTAFGEEQDYWPLQQARRFIRTR